ncbi:TfoX/Sxy family protein [Gaoshiqia sp. Z1-71]|uniref:TfoX/Sxy family protein n=1 Tax=Gaoshiqia hydrogeniformans TaxID=3290090 RepID=UPI003BF8AA20
MTQLSDLPNIGKVVEAKLKEAGIETPEQLIRMGAEQAFIRLSTIDKTVCLSMLCGLEGAIRGIRWHQLPGKRKEELRAFYRITQR